MLRKSSEGKRLHRIPGEDLQPEQEARTHIERLGDVYRTYWSSGDDLSINGHISEQLKSAGTHSAEFIFNGYVPQDGEIMNILHPGTSGHHFTIHKLLHLREIAWNLSDTQIRFTICVY